MISAAPYTIHHSPQESPRGLFSCPLSNTAQHRTKDPPRIAACILGHARGLFLTPMRAGAFIAGAVYYSTLKRTPGDPRTLYPNEEKRGALPQLSEHRTRGKGEGVEESPPGACSGGLHRPDLHGHRRPCPTGDRQRTSRRASENGHHHRHRGPENRPRHRFPPSFGRLHKGGTGCCCIYHPKRR